MKWMMMIAAWSCLLLICTVTSAEFVIQNPTDVINLIPGSTVTQNISFRYIGIKTMTLSIETSILPDEEGIAVTYSNVPSTVSPDTEYSIQMHIFSSFYLAPGEYEIITELSSSQISSPPRTHRVVTQQPIVEPLVEPPAEEEPPVPNDELPEEPQDGESKADADFFFMLMGGIGLIVIFTVLLSYIIGRKRKRGNKP